MLVRIRQAGTRTGARYVGWFTSGRDSNWVWICGWFTSGRESNRVLICWSDYVWPGLELGLDTLVGLHLAGTRTGSGYVVIWPGLECSNIVSYCIQLGLYLSLDNYSVARKPYTVLHSASVAIL